MSVVLKSVSLRYPGREEKALKNVSLEIKKGEIYGILGPTGSGKSSLMWSLNGLTTEKLHARLEGDIIVDGLNTKEHTAAELAQHVGLVLSDPSYSIVSTRVLDDVGFGPSNLGLPTEEIQSRIYYALQATRLSGFENRNTNDLSGGETQALAIAGVLAMKPQILVLDEPLCLLDPIGKYFVLGVIKRLNEEYGATIIISEAGGDIEPFAQFVDGIALIVNGEVKAQGDPSEVFEEREMLVRAGIMSPQVTELGWKLRGANLVQGRLPVTLENLKELVSPLLKEKVQGIGIDRKSAQHLKEPVSAKNPIIKVRNLHIWFPGVRKGEWIKALNGVSFDIYEGDFLGLIGQNGSGKSTLSLSLVGLLKPTNPDAQVIVDGINIHQKKTSIPEIIKHINYTFQNPDDMLFTETPYDEVSYAFKLQGMSRDKYLPLVDQALKTWGIEDIKNEPIMNLTKDKKTLLANAVITSMNPKILIIDEPTTGLDYAGGNKVLSILKKINEEQGKTIIVITHNMKLVAEYARHVIALKSGEILMQGSTREVFANPEKLKEAWLSPPQITQFCQSMTQYGFPSDVLTIDEAFKEVTRLYGSN